VTIEEVLIEAREAQERYWFVQSLVVVERTALTLTLHLLIGSTLFIQVFYSQRSDRFSLALVGPSGRLYGRDCEHGIWHRHPFGYTDLHELTPEGLSPQPIMQFMAEVEDLLIEHELL
jgi:hypothetical protein